MDRPRVKQVPIPILGGYYADEAKPWSAQDVCNWLPTQAESAGGTLTPGILKTPPGLSPYVLIEDADACRGTYNAEGKFFTVIGDQLYQISNNQIAIPVGTVPGQNRTVFAHNQIVNGNQLLTVNGNSGYIYDTVTQQFQRITDPGYPGAINAVFIDGFFVQIEPLRRYAFSSAIADGLNYNTLDRFTSEASPDLLVSMLVLSNELMLLSETSCEFFENTGAVNQPFRTKRISFQKGCAGRYAATVVDNTGFWLGNDGFFYRLNGYTPERISNRAIEQMIRGLDWKNCYAFAWSDSGHSVCYWTFPNGVTIGFDASIGQWHRRESHGMKTWRPISMTFWNQDWYAGDFLRGCVWKLDWQYMLEGAVPFESKRTSQVVFDSMNRVGIPRLELLFDTGLEETVPRDFPIQPDGPEISGGGPDGTVGFLYPGFSYIATGGTGPYTFSLRSGSFPSGLSMNAAGEVGAETPTESGVGTVVIRVTDANGLWDELTDTIAIGFPMMALGTSAIISGGTDWLEPLITTPLGASLGITGAFGRFAIWGTLASSVYYTDDYGATFDPASAPGGINMREDGRYIDGMVIIPLSSPDGLIFSTDNGAVYTYFDAGPLVTIAKTSSLYIGASGTIFRYSTDVDSAWSDGVSHQLFSGLGMEIAANDNEARICGAIDGAGGVRIVSTLNGQGSSIMAIPTMSGTDVAQSIYYDRTHTIWVCGTREGKLLYDDGTGWKLSSYTAIGQIASIFGNGAVIVAVGSSGGGSPGHISYSTDGKNWVDAPYGATFGFVQVTAMQPAPL